MLTLHVQDYKANVFDVAFLSPETVSKFRSDSRMVADYLTQKRVTGDYVPDSAALAHIESTLQLLEVVPGDHRFGDAILDVDELQDGRPSNMCEVLDRIEKRGRRQVVEGMLREGAPIHFIARVSSMGQDAIRSLAASIGVSVVS